jgi:hypothetical protein
MLVEAGAPKFTKNLAGKKPFDLATNAELKKILFDTHNTLILG